MTTGKITAVCGVPGSAFPAIKPGATAKLAFAGASVQSAAVNSRIVRVISSSDCHIAFGSNPTATANDLLLPANKPEYFVCNPTDLIAAIQDAAGGNLYITPAL